MIINIHAHPYDRTIHEENIRVSGTPPGIGMSANPHPFLKDKMGEFFANLTLEKFIADMNEAGVDKAVLLPVDFERTLGHVISDEYTYQNWVKKHPDKFISFSGVDPIDRAGRTNRKALKNFEKAIKEYGFIGLKLLPAYQQYAANDRRIYPFYEKALEFGVPVMLHMGITPTPNAPARFSKPEQLEDIVMDFPGLKLIAAHLAKPWTEELFVLMVKYGNIYTDNSALCKIGLRMLTWYLLMAKDYGVFNRIMWGTDNSCLPHKDCVEWYKTGPNKTAEKYGWPTLTKEEIDNMMGGAAAKLLKL